MPNGLILHDCDVTHGISGAPLVKGAAETNGQIIGLIWSFAVILRLVPVFDSGSAAITRAAEAPTTATTPSAKKTEPKISRSPAQAEIAQ